MLAAAGVLVDLSILCQSRGSLVALPATALVFLLAVPMRLRLVAIVVPLAAAVGLGAATLIHVSQAILYQDGAVRAIDAARSTILTTAIALFVLGAILGLVDSRVVLPRRLVRIAGVTLTAAALAPRPRRRSSSRRSSTRSTGSRRGGTSSRPTRRTTRRDPI